MSRKSCIDALVNGLSDLADFSFEAGGTVVAYDNRAAAAGVSRAIVVRHIRGEDQPMLLSWDWYLAADVWVRTNNKLGEARGTASVLVDNVMAHLNADRGLGEAVTEAVPTEVRTVSEAYRFANGTFIIESITVRVREPA